MNGYCSIGSRPVPAHEPMAVKNGRSRRRVYAYVLLFFVMVAVSGIARAQVGPTRFTILFTNDTHGHVRSFDHDGMSKVGGAAHRASLVAEITAMNRDLGRETFLFDAGDVFMKDPMFDVFRGEVDARVMRMMGYQAMCLGNQEFTMPLECLDEFRRRAGFPLLATNVFVKGDHSYFADAYATFRVGSSTLYVLGVVTDSVGEMVNRENVAGLVFEDPVESVKSTVSRLKGAPGDDSRVVVVMVHDILSRAVEISRIPGIDLVISAHEHRLITPPVKGQGCPIIQAYKYGLYLGRADFTLRGGRITGFKSRLIPVGDPGVAKVIGDYEDIFVNRKMKVVVGTLDNPLDGKECKSGATSLSTFLVEAFRKQLKCDVMAINAGVVGKVRIDSGPVTVEEVFSILPYDNVLQLRRLRGSELIDFLQDGDAMRGRNGYLHFSGASGALNPSAWLVGGKPVKPDEYYLVGSTDFIYSGGDGHDQRQSFEKIGPGIFMRQALTDYLKAAAKEGPGGLAD